MITKYNREPIPQFRGIVAAASPDSIETLLTQSALWRLGWKRMKRNSIEWPGANVTNHC